MALTAPKHMPAGHQQKIQGDWDRRIGGGEGTAEESPPAGRVTDGTDCFRFAGKPEVAHSIIDSRPLDNISRIPI